MLRLIEVSKYPPERVEQLWEHLREEDYAWDDTTRGDHQVLLEILFAPRNECYEIEDMQGFVSVGGLIPNVQATIHFAHWGDLAITTIRAYGLQLMGDLFARHDLHRLNAIIPEHNGKAKRLATLLGFKFEGTLREAFLYKGQFLDLYAYGILRKEFDTFKEISNASRGSSSAVNRRNGSAGSRLSSRS